MSIASHRQYDVLLTLARQGYQCNYLVIYDNAFLWSCNITALGNYTLHYIISKLQAVLGTYSVIDNAATHFYPLC